MVCVLCFVLSIVVLMGTLCTPVDAARAASDTTEDNTPAVGGDEGGLMLDTNALQDAQPNVGGDDDFPIAVLLFSPELNDIAMRQRHEMLHPGRSRHMIRFSAPVSAQSSTPALERTRHDLFRDYHQHDTAPPSSPQVSRSDGNVWLLMPIGVGCVMAALLLGRWLGRQQARRRVA